MEAKLKSFVVCLIIIVGLMVWSQGSNVYIIKMQRGDALFPTIMMAFVLWITLGNRIITPMFQSSINERENKNWELAQQKKNEEEYQRQLNRDMERKRAELRIELEHLEQVARIQGSIDQAKLDKLEQMQAKLSSQKQSDLNALREQIERMKKG